MSTSKQDLRARAMSWNDEPEEAWRPEPGDVVVGVIRDIDERMTQYGSCPVLVIEDEDQHKVVSVWAFHTVLRNELARHRPQVGERIAIRRLEDAESEAGRYKRYRVLMERDKPQTFDWGRVDPQGSDVPVEKITPETLFAPGEDLAF